MQVIVEWSKEKNELLKETRGVCFEDVENCIINGEIIDLIPHYNLEKYPNQKIYIVAINDYLHYVPFVQDEEKIFLKNIIPSRKLMKKY
ncbi:MAG: toxin [Gammaproteobacteria bacterium]|nr:toxin [Gammaproteobacteria bacterium]